MNDGIAITFSVAFLILQSNVIFSQGTCQYATLLPHLLMSTTFRRPYGTGAVLRFKCERGYKMNGKSMTVCLKTGKWSSEIPLCQGPDKATWDIWVQVGLCSKSCGTGTLTLRKKCYENGNQVHISQCGGRAGSDTKTEVCNVEDCQSSHQLCGKPGNVNPSKIGRVISGTDANPGAWPWQALILHNPGNSSKVNENLLIGGASVINRKWILTAAHMFDRFADSFGNIDFGDHFLIALGATKYPPNGSAWPNHIHIYKPQRVIKHEKHKPLFYDYDVALMRVGERLVVRGSRLVADNKYSSGFIMYSDFIRPVCLPCMQYVYANNAFNQEACKKWGDAIVNSENKKSKEGVVTGYGLMMNIYGEYDFPGGLQQGDVRLMNHSRCAESARKIQQQDTQFKTLLYTKQMICTEPANFWERTDACSGDSGGPLVLKEVDGRNRHGPYNYFIMGIVSWGLECGNEHPGFYTSTPAMMPWILNETDFLKEQADARSEGRRNALGTWLSWAPCSATCGHGQQTRTRHCLDELTRAIVKDELCEGSTAEIRKCNHGSCRRRCTRGSCNNGMCFGSGSCGCFPKSCGVTCNQSSCKNSKECQFGLYFEEHQECFCWDDFGYNTNRSCSVHNQSMCNPPCNGWSICRRDMKNKSTYFCDLLV